MFFNVGVIHVSFKYVEIEAQGMPNRKIYGMVEARDSKRGKKRRNAICFNLLCLGILLFFLSRNAHMEFHKVGKTLINFATLDHKVYGYKSSIWRRYELKWSGCQILVLNYYICNFRNQFVVSFSFRLIFSGDRTYYIKCISMHFLNKFELMCTNNWVWIIHLI